MEKEVENIILEAIWISRWNKDKTALTAVLTPIEADQIYMDLIENLKTKGYEIIKVNRRTKNGNYKG